MTADGRPDDGTYASPPTRRGGWPLLGDVRAFRRDPLAFLAAVAREGDVVRMRLGRGIFLLNHPDHVQRVLHDNHANYRKSFVYARLKPLVGDGLLTTEGAEWKRRRRLIQPAFHKERLAGLAAIVARHARAMIDRWAGAAERGAAVDVGEEMMRLTLTVVGHALFGFDLLGEADEAGRAASTGIRITNDRFFALLYAPRLPTPSNVAFDRAVRVLDGLVGKLIAARRAGEPREDLLGMLLEARDAETGDGLTDRELRDELMTMVLAGHETTAKALTWALLLLDAAPDVDRRLHDHVAEVLGGRDATLADLARLDFAARVSQEAMRLYPPVWAFGREAIAGDTFGRYRIPPGAAVSIAPWLLHRDPRFWRDPERFDPDRFLPEEAASRPKYAYLPFAAGPRMCIGSAFASMEMQIALAMIVDRYRLELVPGERVELEASVTLRPRGAVRMRVMRRPARDVAAPSSFP